MEFTAKIVAIGDNVGGEDVRGVVLEISSKEEIMALAKHDGDAITLRLVKAQGLRQVSMLGEKGE